MVENKASCRNYGGSCCTDNILSLNAQEAEWMRKSGSTLVPEFEAQQDLNWGQIARDYPDSEDPEEQEGIERARRLKRGAGTYFMVGACGNLIKRDGWMQCEEYENPERPSICADFKEGSVGCQEIFDARAGVFVQLTQKPVNIIVDFPLATLSLGPKIRRNYEERYGIAG